MNKKGFTLIELLAVIVVLAIVMVLATTTVLPYMANARQDAFLIEATNVVKAAEKAVELDMLDKIQFTSGKSFKDETKGEMCFTVDELVRLGIYKADSNVYKGKIVIKNLKDKDITNDIYTLTLEKNAEFIINGATSKNYKGQYESIKNTGFADSAYTC